MAVSETGVECEADVLCPVERPRAISANRNSHSAHDIGKGKRVSTSARNGRGQTTIERTNLSKNTDDDIIVFDINRRRENLIWIVIVYNHRAREAGEKPAGRQNRQKMMRQVGGGTVLM
jgi:hypothetical protein